MSKLKKVAKWSGIALGALVLVLAVTVGVAMWRFDSRMSAHYDVPSHPFEVPTDQASIEEGARLYLARGCGECHGRDGAGRILADAPPFLIAPPNITGVVRSYSEADLDRIIRHGVRPNGEPVFFMPGQEFNRMPDRELGAIIAYARTLEQVPTTQPPSELRPVGAVLAMLGVFEDGVLIPAEVVDHAHFDPAPDPAPTAEYGSYLAHACMGCHGAGLSGGPVPGAPEEVTGRPRNLTLHETGLRGWSEADFEAAVRHGRTPDGSELDPVVMPWRVYASMNDTEVSALWAYLATVEPRALGNR